MYLFDIGNPPMASIFRRHNGKSKFLLESYGTVCSTLLSLVMDLRPFVKVHVCVFVFVCLCVSNICQIRREAGCSHVTTTPKRGQYEVSFVHRRQLGHRGICQLASVKHASFIAPGVKVSSNDCSTTDLNRATEIELYCKIARDLHHTC